MSLVHVVDYIKSTLTHYLYCPFLSFPALPSWLPSLCSGLLCFLSHLPPPQFVWHWVGSTTSFPSSSLTIWPFSFFLSFSSSSCYCRNLCCVISPFFKSTSFFFSRVAFTGGKKGTGVCPLILPSGIWEGNESTQV